ncbi:hypothetical protein DRO61_12060 [Candidatus Bathyarchaeota archaeon]|nr:MAG: hypothetical protein DRO61_12060 [Candidatus Bathyarchaeota archaeon]
MKKYILFIFMLLPFALLAQGIEPSFWKTSEFWMLVAPIALLVLNWVLRLIPTTKPLSIAVKTLIKILGYFMEGKFFKNNKKNGDVHKD